jgi:hypothetical protein
LHSSKTLPLKADYGSHRKLFSRKPRPLGQGRKAETLLSQYLEIVTQICYTEGMKLTAVVKLLPTDDQYRALRQTLERANAASTP